MGDWGDSLVITIIHTIIFSFVLYFAPSFIACNRKHPKMFYIFLLNLFLGLTFIGWILAFMWADESDIQVEGEPPIIPWGIFSILLFLLLFGWPVFLFVTEIFSALTKA